MQSSPRRAASLQYTTHQNLSKTAGSWLTGDGIPDLFRRAATYVDKILKGAKPADLPVEQPVEVRVHRQSQSGEANRLDNSAECLGAGGPKSSDSREQGAKSKVGEAARTQE